MNHIAAERRARRTGQGHPGLLFAALLGVLSTVPALGVQSVTTAWDPSPATNLVCYVIHYGPASGSYTDQLLVPTNEPTATIDNLIAGQLYYFVVTARSVAGLESAPSNEVSTNAPGTNRPPIATAADIQTIKNQPVAVTLSGTDPDGDVIDYAILAAPTHGALTGVAPNLTFVPNTNFAGPDSFTFRVTDGVSNSAPATVSIMVDATAAPTSRLTVQTQGNGTVTPNLNGQYLLLGHSYKLSSTPAAGAIFTGWSGGVTSSATSVTFLMTSNLVLAAGFMTDPYTPVAGSYNGLFYEAADVRAGSSGFLTVKATGKGTYSGKLILGKRKHGFSGHLDFGCRTTNVLARPGTNALTVELDFIDGGAVDQLTGRVTDGFWAATLLADRACFDAKTNIAPFAGSYTLIVPGTNNAGAGPEGDGFGTVKVDSRGMVGFAGTLPDGSKLTQKVSLSHSGAWPLYVPLYKGLGAVLSWQTISNLPGTDIAGLLSWIRPGQPTSKYWPAGFTNDTVTIGSVYTPPGLTNQVLDCTQTEITFTGGNFASSLTNVITLDPQNKITCDGTNELSLALTLKSGLFAGKVLDPLTGKSMKFKGAVLQKQNGGAGFLLGTNKSARVTFGL